MIKKAVSYADFNGEQQNETLYFNLSEMELIKMGWVDKNGPSAKLTALDPEKDIVGAIAMIEELVVNAYGKKSEDGRSFSKNPVEAESFKNSAAFMQLLEDIMSKPNEMEAFLKGIMPSRIANNM